MLSERFQSLDTGLSVGPIRISKTLEDHPAAELTYLPIAVAREYVGVPRSTISNWLNDPEMRRHYGVEAVRDPLNNRLYISSQCVRQVRSHGLPREI
jgi:hypothetical protein